MSPFYNPLKGFHLPGGSLLSALQEHKRVSVNIQCLLKPGLGTGQLSVLSTSHWPDKSHGQSQREWIGMQKNPLPVAESRKYIGGCGCKARVRDDGFRLMTPSTPSINFKIDTK